MALLTYPYLTGFNWEDTAPYVDMPVFGADNPSGQPPGRSIMLLEPWQDYANMDLSVLPVDWSRILAAKIDEPFAHIVLDYARSVFFSGCNAQRAGIADTKSKLMDVAAAVHAAAPRTRLWVNYAEKEVQLMRRAWCPLALNDPTIDVVSLDKYHVPFSSIQTHYDWFNSAWPQQQIALIPATAYSAGGDSPQSAAARLQGYFDYANQMNRLCDSGLGRMGRTGNYDGCRVWIVAGWSSEPYFPHDGAWYSLFWPGNSAFPSGQPILDAWAQQFSKARRSGPRTLTDEELAAQ